MLNLDQNPNYQSVDQLVIDKPIQQFIGSNKQLHVHDVNILLSNCRFRHNLQILDFTNNELSYEIFNLLIFFPCTDLQILNLENNLICPDILNSPLYTKFKQIYRKTSVTIQTNKTVTTVQQQPCYSNVNIKIYDKTLCQLCRNLCLSKAQQSQLSQYNATKHNYNNLQNSNTLKSQANFQLSQQLLNSQLNKSNINLDNMINNDIQQVQISKQEQIKQQIQKEFQEKNNYILAKHNKKYDLNNIKAQQCGDVNLLTQFLNNNRDFITDRQEKKNETNIYLQPKQQLIQPFNFQIKLATDQQQHLNQQLLQSQSKCQENNLNQLQQSLLNSKIDMQQNFDTYDLPNINLIKYYYQNVENTSKQPVSYNMDQVEQIRKRSELINNQFSNLLQKIQNIDTYNKNAGNSILKLQSNDQIYIQRSNIQQVKQVTIDQIQRVNVSYSNLFQKPIDLKSSFNNDYYNRQIIEKPLITDSQERKNNLSDTNRNQQQVQTNISNISTQQSLQRSTPHYNDYGLKQSLIQQSITQNQNLQSNNQTKPSAIDNKIYNLATKSMHQQGVMNQQIDLLLSKTQQQANNNQLDIIMNQVKNSSSKHENINDKSFNQQYNKELQQRNQYVNNKVDLADFMNKTKQQNQYNEIMQHMIPRQIK